MLDDVAEGEGPEGREGLPPAQRVRSVARLYGSIGLVAGKRSDWHLGIGDPTFAGWFTVFAYLVAAWSCGRAARHARSRGAPSRLVWAWRALVVLMLGLGINKQLDLQSWLIETARELALAQGWYEGRRAVQGLFVKALAGGSALLGFSVVFVLRREVRHLWLAALGCGLIAAFVVVRAASFSHVEAPGALGGRLRWGLELGGIVLVALAAYRNARPGPDARP